MITDERTGDMRWGWHKHAPVSTPLEEAIMLTECLLAEHDRLVQSNQESLGALRESVDAATLREKK